MKNNCLISVLFHHNIPNESDKYAKELGVEGPDIPDVDGGDDKCFGRVEIIRFNTGPKIGRLRKDITSIKLNTFEHLHWTEESLIRMPLYKAYMAQSMIRIDSPRCSEPEIEFKGFTFMARGTPPPIGGLGLYLDPLHTSTYYHVEKITSEYYFRNTSLCGRIELIHLSPSVQGKDILYYTYLFGCLIILSQIHYSPLSKFKIFHFDFIFSTKWDIVRKLLWIYTKCKSTTNRRKCSRCFNCCKTK